MTDKIDEKSEFIVALKQALTAQQFVRLTLSKYRGDDDLNRIEVTLIRLDQDTLPI